jgi:ABC-type branched-subunit amino acid transport system substrate-binding protein
VKRLPNQQASVTSAIKKCVALLAGVFIAISLSERVSADATDRKQLTPQERRGKQIYQRGVSASGGEIKAILGDELVSLPATAAACANCHGLDGQGKPEGGVIPSNITWEAITKSYDVTAATGRQRPAYTERSLERAITEGIDSGGNKLQAVMPKYLMSTQDLADLIAYLKLVGKDRDPGVTETSIKIGTVLPTRGPLAEIGQAITGLVNAYFSEINNQGGLFNRRVELQVAQSDGTEAEIRASMDRLIKSGEVFAILGAYIAGADKELISLVEDEQMPLIGPLTLSPQNSQVANRHVFYLYSGLREQGRALAKFATQKVKLEKPRVVIILPEVDEARSSAQAVEEYFKGAGWSSVTRLKYLRGRFDARLLADELRRRGADVVFFFGSGSEDLMLLKEADKQELKIEIFIPGSLAAKDIFDAPLRYRDKIHLSFPTLPSDQTEAGLAEYRTLAEKYNLPPRYLAAQFSAHSAAKILVEGLKRAGKDLSREKLISSLETLYEFSTGLTRTVSYGPNQRIGAPGAYILLIDLEKKQFIPISGWITPN